MITVSLLAVVAACPGSSSAPAAPGNKPDLTSTAPAKEPEMPTVASFEDVRHHVGKDVMVVGKYEIVDTGRHKVAYTKPDGSTGMTNKVVRIGFHDGHGVDLWVRPDAEQKQLSGKMVIAKGKLIAEGGGGVEGAAAMDAAPSLVQITSVEAAP